jgi:hypothetical protein
MGTKQSAVEFAVNKLANLIPSGNQILIRAILIEAKEMEKQQIMESYKDSTSQFSVDARIDYPKSAEQYYNEQFKNK